MVHLITNEALLCRDIPYQHRAADADGEHRPGGTQGTDVYIARNRGAEGDRR
jgi:hypothetical protein